MNSIPVSTQATNGVVMKRNGSQSIASSPSVRDSGMVLLDSSLMPVAFDHGAAAILGNPAKSGINRDQVCIPEEILDAVRECGYGALSSVKASFRRGTAKYVCRLYLLEPQSLGSTQRFLALHFERESSARDAVHRLSSEYHLTDREEQALRGIALGLSGKQLAERMNISPNTVKVYLRLIMAKMGVTGRGEIAAKLLSSGAEAGWRTGQEVTGRTKPVED
jgi:DNA-binding CsgD family transcriptional regulator